MAIRETDHARAKFQNTRPHDCVTLKFCSRRPAVNKYLHMETNTSFYNPCAENKHNTHEYSSFYNPCAENKHNTHEYSSFYNPCAENKHDTHEHTSFYFRSLIVHSSFTFSQDGRTNAEKSFIFLCLAIAFKFPGVLVLCLPRTDYNYSSNITAKLGSCLLWVMSTEIAVDIAVDTRSLVGRHSVVSRSTLGR